MEYKDNSGRNISYGNNYSNGARVDTNVGIPYQDINWYEIKGQPFGIGSRFNVLVFGDANNIVDTKGAMAVGGNFSSPRGLSLAFGNDSKMEGTGYSPYAVRFLVGGNINMNKPLVVVGHVVGGGAFRAGSGSTYLIGKTNSQTQQQQLADLYSASGGSDYWKPSEKGDHFVISSYDTPRFIPAERIRANLPAFFQNARDSITRYKNCISSLPSNGTIVDNYHELILRGNDPNQNIFDIDVRSNGGVFNKGLRPEVPEGSLIIIRFLTGDNAYMQYGVWGDKRLATRTLYVFEDASHIHMKTSSDIWGSILAPQAVFHAHPTGGHVSGNAALGGFDVSANSGFEFHMFPFKGGVNCQMVAPAPAPAPVPAPVPAPAPAPAPAPVPAPAPCPPCPIPTRGS
jgi:choice-of-anchor A domain-containing protein